MGRGIFVALVCCAIAFGANFQLSNVPDGYPAGRPGAPYGSYGSVFGEGARGYDARLETLQMKIHGLSKLANADEVRQAELVYYLEYMLVAMFSSITHATEPMSSFEREALLYRVSRLYRDLRVHAERLYETMIRVVDVALPGATGLQQPLELPSTLEVLYAPNCRSEKCLTEEERKAIYQKKFQEFLAAGGAAAELTVLNSAWVSAAKDFTRVEYVVRANGEIWITEGKAGHLLLAGGERASAAGQMAFFKDAKGKLIWIAVSNSSGNYKPDLFTAERLAQRLHEELLVPAERIVVTKGEPFSVQTVKVLLKARQTDAGISAAKIKEMEALAAEILKGPGRFFTVSSTGTSCPQLLLGEGI